MRPPYEFPELPVLHGPALTQLSDDAFFELCQANPALHFERNAHQEIITTPPAGSESSESSGEVHGQLWLWNRQNRPGHTYESSAGFKLPDASVGSPAAAWLSEAKWAQLTPEQRRRFPPVCPEFVVEVKSPSDSLADLQARMETYPANGVLLGFLLDVAAETAYVYRPGQPPETVHGYDQALPGFQLDSRPLKCF